MSSKYCEISFKEMNDFLTDLGFSQIEVANSREYVYGKIIRYQDFKYCLRIYTSVSIDENVSRDIGEDAIRLMFFIKKEGSKLPIKVGAIGKVLRIDTWQKNLSQKIDKATDNLLAPGLCPDCGNPMILKESKKKGNEYRFWGCINYFAGCRGIRNV